MDEDVVNTTTAHGYILGGWVGNMSAMVAWMGGGITSGVWVGHGPVWVCGSVVVRGVWQLLNTRVHLCANAGSGKKTERAVD